MVVETKPTIISVTAVNPTLDIGGSAQVQVAFTPNDASAMVYFRFDLKKGSGATTGITEGDWVQVPRSAGTVVLTFTRGGVPGIPADWGSGQQIGMQLVWKGHDTGADVRVYGVVNSVFTVAQVKPQILNIAPVVENLMIGATPKMRVTFTSESVTPFYFQVNLRIEKGTNWALAFLSPALLLLPSSFWNAWQESGWQRVSPVIGTNTVDVAAKALPNNWFTTGGSPLGIDGKLSFSKTGSGNGDYMIEQADEWWLPVKTDTGQVTPTPTPDPTNPTITPNGTQSNPWPYLGGWMGAGYYSGTPGTLSVTYIATQAAFDAYAASGGADFLTKYKWWLIGGVVLLVLVAVAIFVVRRKA